MKTLACCFLAAAAALSSAPSSAFEIERRVAVRPPGVPLTVRWTARVAPAGEGEFRLYRLTVWRAHEMARLPLIAGRAEYSVEERAALDASADYELRWFSPTHGEVVLGRLRCERPSRCVGLPSPEQDSSRAALELAAEDFAPLLEAQRVTPRPSQASAAVLARGPDRPPPRVRVR